MPTNDSSVKRLRCGFLDLRVSLGIVIWFFEVFRTVSPNVRMTAPMVEYDMFGRQGALLADTKIGNQSWPKAIRRRMFGSARGLIKIADDFDEPLEDFQEYVRESIEVGVRDADAGRVVSVDEVRARFGLSSGRDSGLVLRLAGRRRPSW